MPNIKSAKKRVLTSAKKHEQNKMDKTALKMALKKMNAALASKNAAEAEALRSATVTVIDTSVRKNIIHKNKAANLKSAIDQKLNALKAEPQA